jgi:Flp pilus assembly protein TadG
MAIAVRFHRLRNRVWSFRSAESGNTLMIFALMLVPIVGAVGAAVDYSVANKARTELQALADAAAVGSIANTAPAMIAAASMSSDGPIPVGAADALKIFNGQLASKMGFIDAKPTATVVKAKGVITATVSFSATVPTKFLGLLGKLKVPITGTATAAHKMPTFIDFYLLLDNTPSMGVGATPADVAKMVNNTPDQCAFACHDLSSYPNDYYSKAKQLGVQMRIDVVRLATQQLMDTATASETISDQFRAAIYTFGSSCTDPGLSVIKALTSNLSSAKTAAANIDLMTIPYQGYANHQCTNFDSVLTGVNSKITTPGTGTSAASPQKLLFFVSDGVNDANKPTSCSKPLTGGTRCQEPIDVSFCKTIKDRGIKIAVLYTTYLPLPTNSWYNTWIKPWQSEIGPKMQACASPGLYFEVSPTQGISDAMKALFKKAMAQVHLTK